MSKNNISVEVAYASDSKQFMKSLHVEVGTTVIQAIELSGIRVEFPELDLASSKIGIFSRFVSGDYVLKEFDRIEIYRPLLIDPKESRRRRAMQNKSD